MTPESYPKRNDLREKLAKVFYNGELNRLPHACEHRKQDIVERAHSLLSCLQTDV
jgi:hypothetical protein